VPRHPGQPNRLAAYGELLNRKLAGSNIEPRAPLFGHRAGLSAAVLNPSGATRMHGASVAVGTLLGAAADWHVPRAPLPDGSYGLLRSDDSYVELIADSTASRTWWYAFTDDELIVSSSQRAIVTLLGSFEPNREALPWMLSSGTLGPTCGWDVRLRRVQPGERVLLDRARWRLRSTFEPVSFAADRDLPRASHLERLQASVAAACDRWVFDARKWALTLSGGADSRSLLCLLRDRGLATVTWGLTHADEQEGNDARIAREVARLLAVPHRFLAIDSPADAPDVVLDRFLAVGEGRVDRIAGYVDGFCVWKTLFDEGYEGVVRGDEAFGWIPTSSPYAVRAATGLTTLADFFPAKELERFELPAQPLPEPLLRGRDETLATWRDRLYQQSRVPTFLAALTDLKTAYLEVGTPLLARSVLECVRAMPDELRTQKRLWMELVTAQLPEVPFARRVAISSVNDFLMDERVLTLLKDELRSEQAAALFAPPLRARLCAGLGARPPAARADLLSRWRHTALARAVPTPLKAIVRNLRRDRPSLEPLVLSFRALVAARMHGVLRADAATPAPETTVDAWRSRYRAV
jgi:hypothetical protein